MKYRRLGRSNIEVSVICQGGWSLTGGRTWGEQDRADSVAALRTAFDAGITFIDTSENYGESGESERLVARALEGVRDEIVLATKVARQNLSADGVRAACENSLRRLATDYIDLYQVHWPNPDVPMAETIGAMEALKSEGKIRLIGVSNFGATYLDDLPAAVRVHANQIAYNLLFRPPELLVGPTCVENEISLICYSSLAQGLLCGKFASAEDVPEGRARTRLFAAHRPLASHDEVGCEQEVFEALREIQRICDGLGRPMTHVALAWLLAQPGVASVIAGARNAAQARDNSLASDLQLSPDTVAALSKATEPVKARLGSNCDQWQVPSRMERPI